jgi:hypothetical protein
MFTCWQYRKWELLVSVTKVNKSVACLSTSLSVEPQNLKKKIFLRLQKGVGFDSSKANLNGKREGFSLFILMFC